MKNKLLLTPLLLVAISIGSVTTSYAQFWKKKDKIRESAIPVSFNTKQYNFGYVQINEYPYYEFHFTNNSKYPIRIKEFDRACNVTIPAFSKNVIGPGQTGYFKIMFNPRDVHGQFTKTMKVIFSYKDNDLPEGENKERLSQEVITLKGDVTYHKHNQD